MKVGDLVVLKHAHRYAERHAMIISTHWHSGVKIVFLDSGERRPALRSNLEVISEAR